MLQELEKEIDDVDATIGDRWQLLDRSVNAEAFEIFLSRHLQTYNLHCSHVLLCHLTKVILGLD